MKIDGRFRARVLAGEFLPGCWLNLGSAITAEMAGLTGFDWVVPDHDHGPYRRPSSNIPLVAPAVAWSHRLERSVRFKRINPPARSGGATSAHPPGGGGGRDALPRSGAIAGCAIERPASFDEYFAHAHVAITTRIDAAGMGMPPHRHDGVDVLFIGPMDLTTAWASRRCERRRRSRPSTMAAARAAEGSRHLRITATMCGTIRSSRSARTAARPVPACVALAELRSR